MAGSADALQATRHRLGRLDLQDKVYRAHVDAQLQGGGGHQARQLAGLELLLDRGALLARERAVVGPGDLAPRRRALFSSGGTPDDPSPTSPAGSPGPSGSLGGQLVEAQRDPLGRAAVVDEHDRGAVFAHQGKISG